MAKVYTETFGHYNVFRKNSPQVVAEDVSNLLKRCSVVDLDEVIPGLVSAVKRVIRDHKFDSVHYGSVWLVWDPKVWDEMGFYRQVKLCRSAKELGYNIPFHPERHLIGQGLNHVKSNTNHLVTATHLPQGYAKEEGEKADRIARLEDLQAMEAVHKLDVTLEEWIKDNPRFNFHYLQGDMNSRQSNRQEHWYPANALRDQWVPDTMPNSIDWMMHSRQSTKHGLDVVRRWSENKGWNSDHPAEFKRVQFPANR